MAYWLVKSEPNKWSWQDHVRDGVAEWDGVRNYQARNNMLAMKVGECAFFYHSQIGLEIVGVLEVATAAHQDSTTEDSRWQCVDFRALYPLGRPLTLKHIKADPKLSDMALVTHSRLSVQPVTAAQWRHICKITDTKAD
ncbi:MAG: EVE domain-containing protein [Pseudomonadota bacterium]